MEFEELKNQQARQDFNYRLPALETVRQAMTTMIPMISNPHISTNPPHLMVSWHNGDTIDLRLEQLSDGYRTLLALVMDLARRLAQANPHLVKPLHSEAIVLIDEIDLHLHPGLQQTVLLDLQRTFPNTQFIVTTHSPQVLTTVQKENIRRLENKTVYSIIKFSGYPNINYKDCI
jgi:predicted ATP-binding protein involved in virulence